MTLRGGLRRASTWDILPGREGRRIVLVGVVASLQGAASLGGAQAQLHKPVAIQGETTRGCVIATPLVGLKREVTG